MSPEILASSLPSNAENEFNASVKELESGPDSRNSVILDRSGRISSGSADFPRGRVEKLRLACQMQTRLHEGARYHSPSPSDPRFAKSS